MLHTGKDERRLVLHNTELGNAGVLVDVDIPGGVHGDVPLVVVPPVGIVHHAHRVGLQQTVVLKGGTAGHHMGLVTLRQFDGDTQGDQAEFSGLHIHILGGVEVDPVGFACHIA